MDLECLSQFLASDATPLSLYLRMDHMGEGKLFTVDFQKHYRVGGIGREI